jgi:4-amino-4-deoxychorismate lyase
VYQIVDHWQINDRAPHYGDGVFTTMRVAKGQIDLFPYHQERLKADTAALFLPTPNTQIFDYAKKQAELLGHGVLKIVLSAGVGGRGYLRPEKLSPTALFFTSSMPKDYDVWRKYGVSVSVSRIQIASQPALAGIKHLNRLEQVLIKQELSGLDETEVLVFDSEQHLVETSTGNVFVLDNHQQWSTPILNKSGVKGVMRAFVMAELRKQGHVVVEKPILLDDIQHANAVAITNALMGVVPVTYLAHKQKHWRFNIEPVLQLADTLPNMSQNTPKECSF